MAWAYLPPFTWAAGLLQNRQGLSSQLCPVIVRAQVLELQNTAQRAKTGAGFGSNKGSSESRRARAPAGKHLNSETFSGPDPSPREGKKTIILHREQTVQGLISLGTLGTWIFLPYQKTVP